MREGRREGGNEYTVPSHSPMNVVVVPSYLPMNFVVLAVVVSTLVAMFVRTLVGELANKPEFGLTHASFVAIVLEFSRKSTHV